MAYRKITVPAGMYTPRTGSPLPHEYLVVDDSTNIAVAKCATSTDADTVVTALNA